MVLDASRLSRGAGREARPAVVLPASDALRTPGFLVSGHDRTIEKEGAVAANSTVSSGGSCSRR